ncbi:hypothetical protein AAVH_27094 [Aphelenchoides avenae]|nr:hypothetical protein AAVH_27094 [Aphelenchus avenae]
MSGDSPDAFIEEHIDPTGTDVLNYKFAASAVVDLDGLRYRRHLPHCDLHKDRLSEDEDDNEKDWGNLNPYQPGHGLYGAW